MNHDGHVGTFMPPAGTNPYQAEPTLTPGDYDHILTILTSMAIIMERSPSAFAAMDEEALCSHFLVQLNGHYRGQATGETFNYEGKTDNLVRAKGTVVDPPAPVLRRPDRLARLGPRRCP